MPCDSVAVVRAKLANKLPVAIAQEVIQETLGIEMAEHFYYPGRIVGTYGNATITYDENMADSNLVITSTRRRDADEARDLLTPELNKAPQRLALQALAAMGAIDKATMDEEGNLLFLLEIQR